MIVETLLKNFQKNFLKTSAKIRLKILFRYRSNKKKTKTFHSLIMSMIKVSTFTPYQKLM